MKLHIIKLFIGLILSALSVLAMAGWTQVNNGSVNGWAEEQAGENAHLPLQCRLPPPVATRKTSLTGGLPITQEVSQLINFLYFK